MSPPEGSPGQSQHTVNPEASLGEQLLVEMLDDAKIVAAYVQKAGLLKTTALPEAISAVENLPVLSWGSPAVVRLQTELNATMHDLAPTTVDDLRGASAPFGGSQRTLYNIAFVLFWAVMIFFVALGTLSHNYGVAIVRSLEELQDNNTGQRIEELVRSIVSSSRTVDPDAPPPDTAAAQRTDFAIASTFLANLDEVRTLDQRTFVAVGNANQFMSENFLALAVVSPTSTVKTLLGWQVVNSKQLDPPDSKGVCGDDQQNAVAERYERPEFGDTAMAGAIRYNDIEGLSFTCMSGFNYHLRDYPPLQKLIETVNLILNVYGLWLLPALYGALGASMYHLRRALNPILPTPSVLRTINRTIMGAFAGIIIAWFWAPAAQSNVELVNVGFNLFAVAFLVGYGIDVFFTFLDRVLVTATGSIAQLGTKSESPPKATQ